jgi:hypothetical protein
MTFSHLCFTIPEIRSRRSGGLAKKRRIGSLVPGAKFGTCTRRRAESLDHGSMTSSPLNQTSCPDASR